MSSQLQILEYGLGKRKGPILLITLDSNGVFQRLTSGDLLVRRAVIQHIGATTTEAITLVTWQGGTLAQGIILNPPTTSGYAGGSISVENVNLYDFFFARTTAGLSLAVYYEQ